mgnify:CR=1 FL=1
MDDPEIGVVLMTNRLIQGHEDQRLTKGLGILGESANGGGGGGGYGDTGADAGAAGNQGGGQALCFPWLLC